MLQYKREFDSVQCMRSRHASVWPLFCDILYVCLLVRLRPAGTFIHLSMFLLLSANFSSLSFSCVFVFASICRAKDAIKALRKRLFGQKNWAIVLQALTVCLGDSALDCNLCFWSWFGSIVLSATAAVVRMQPLVIVFGFLYGCECICSSWIPTLFLPTHLPVHACVRPYVSVCMPVHVYYSSVRIPCLGLKQIYIYPYYCSVPSSTGQ